MINAARKMKKLPDLSALIKKKLSGGKKTTSATPSETTPSKTTPGETTLSETTPGETTPSKETPGQMTPSEPPPPAVSSGPPVGPINIESSREDLMQWIVNLITAMEKRARGREIHPGGDCR